MPSMAAEGALGGLLQFGMKGAERLRQHSYQPYRDQIAEIYGSLYDLEKLKQLKVDPAGMPEELREAAEQAMALRATVIDRSVQRGKRDVTDKAARLVAQTAATEERRRWQQTHDREVARDAATAAYRKGQLGIQGTRLQPKPEEPGAVQENMKLYWDAYNDLLQRKLEPYQMHPILRKLRADLGMPEEVPGSVQQATRELIAITAPMESEAGRGSWLRSVESDPTEPESRRQAARELLGFGAGALPPTGPADTTRPSVAPVSPQAAPTATPTATPGPAPSAMPRSAGMPSPQAAPTGMPTDTTRTPAEQMPATVSEVPSQSVDEFLQLVGSRYPDSDTLITALEHGIRSQPNAPARPVWEAALARLRGQGR